MSANLNSANAASSVVPFYPYTEEIFRNVFDFYGTLDTKGCVISLNGTIFKQTKADPSMLIGQPLSETVFWQASENNSRTVEEAIERAAAGEKSDVIVDFRVSSDKKVPVEMIFQPLKRDGSPDAIFFSGQQITRRQRTVDSPGRYCACGVDHGRHQ